VNKKLNFTNKNYNLIYSKKKILYFSQ
jgi:hypothetical protein